MHGGGASGVGEGCHGEVFQPHNTDKPKINDQQARVFAARVGPCSLSASRASFAFGNLGDDRKRQQPKAVNRCWSCNKKVGLTGFMCKCGMTFCGMHWYPKKHECMFDIKAIGHNAIAKANPLVNAYKRTHWRIKQSQPNCVL
jgi:hypothetical protein